MTNIFEGLKQYALKWQQQDSRKFNESELACIQQLKVVDSEFGLSLECTLTNSVCYIPLSINAQWEEGDIIKPEDVNIISLVRNGEIILRAEN